ENIDAPTQMHLHKGAAGVAGPVALNLGVATSGGPGTLIGSTVTLPGLINLILADPDGYCVEIHNGSFPAGAVRGQLLVPCGCRSDLNRDGVVDGADLGLLLAAWDTDDACADSSGDGNVDGADLGLLLADWGACP